MTEEKTSKVRYLTEIHIQEAHAVLCEIALKDNNERMPPLAFINREAFEGLLEMPKQSVYGNEVYPEIYDKAAIIYYTIVKQHIFINGNKRLAAASLLWFIIMNGYQLAVTENELTQKTLNIAKSDPNHFLKNKQELTDWLRTHMQKRADTELKKLRLIA